MLLSRLIRFITANFRFANYTADRRRELKKLFSRTAIAMILVGFALLPASSYLTALLCVSGCMFTLFAGGVDVSDRILTRKERRVPFRFQTVKVYASQTYACTRTHNHNHARSYRGASRPTFSRNTKNNSDSGESDSGDPPGPLPSLTPSPTCNRQSNRSLFPWQRPGCWCMACEQAVWGCFA